MKFFLPLFLIFTMHIFGQDTTQVKSKTTKEVTITAQKPQIKVEAGKTTLETSNTTIQQGTLKTLMEQMPGVMFDNNNNVSVKGKSGLRILIDGKTSQLALSDMKAFMESIPATSIKSIEVLTNPGAQYDAEGKSGIINIKLKKDRREGFNTKISAGMGTLFNKFSGGFFSNYKNDKFNIFANYQYNYNDQWFGYSEARKSNYEGNVKYYDYIASWKDYKNTHNFKTGIDLFIAKNSTIGYTLDFNLNDGHGNNYLDNTSEQYDENHNLVKKYLATNVGTNVVKTVSNGLSFKQIFDSSKTEWTADISHTYFDEVNNNVNENLAYSPTGSALNNEYYYFEPQLHNQVHNLMMKTDVTLQTLFAKLDFGLKNESNFNQNIYKAYLKDFGTARYTSDKYSNDFNYNDNVFATYLTATKNLGFFQIDAGARLENTIISSNNPAVSRQYLNLFPNFGISFPLDSFTYVSARYSRRIDRPSFNKLNNRVVYYNRYTANIGVPTLQPEMSDIISAQVERSFMKGALNISLGAEYNMETNDIDEFSYIDSTYVSYFTAANIGTANLFSTTLNIYFRPSKFFDINLTPQLLITEYKTTLNNIYYESKGTTTQLSGQTNFYLPLGFKLSLNGFMTPKMIWTQGSSEFLGMLNGSISKSFLKEKLNVVLSCSDIFNSNTWIGYQNTGNVNSQGVWKPETRIAWLNFTYSVGKKINYRRKDIEKSDRIQGTGR
jgi:iron complex outermembrane recepter protein